MFAAVRQTVFFANIIIPVFILFAGRCAAASVGAGLRVLADFIILAVLICTAIIIGSHRVDADAVAFDKSGCLTGIIRIVIVITALGEQPQSANDP
jgi:hypothetical protein